MSKIQANLGAFTVHHIDDAKWYFYIFEKYSGALPYKEGDDTKMGLVAKDQPEPWVLALVSQNEISEAVWELASYWNGT